jgi:hypothetical protein
MVGVSPGTIGVGIETSFGEKDKKPFPLKFPFAFV